MKEEVKILKRVRTDSTVKTDVDPPPAKTEGTTSPRKASSHTRVVSPPSARFSTLLILTLLSFVTRLYHVEIPDWVCWDETHFGKMASWYINRTFFFDVHPPFGKMSISLVGYLSGYNGTFAWDKPGDKFDGHSYVGMRVFCAILGALLVPLAFETVYALCRSWKAAVIAGCCILCDNGLITLTRYILLDAPLLFFIMAAAWACVKSWHHENRQLNFHWWYWHCLCGFFLSCAMSTKFVGAFVVLWVGLSTVFRLLILWSDNGFPLTQLAKQFLCRTVCLIILPVIIYVGFFAIHLAVLNRSGPGDGFYSSAFQSMLIGNSLNNATMPGEVAYGSMIALKSTKGNGAYLHSHVHLYPSSTDETGPHQQVTCYSHKDDNNIWMLKKVDEEVPVGGVQKVELLKNGDLFRLTHVVTGRNLHAHKIAAPVTRHHFQVSAYGGNGTEEENDIWQIVIDKGGSKEVVKTLFTHARFIHQNTQCVLESATKQLPKWAWEQLEVTCNPRPKKSSFDNQLFHVEWTHFPLLPNVTFTSHAPSFIKRLAESHHIMIKGNSMLKAKEGEDTSRPWQWPIDIRGQFFSASELRIYLLGNPNIWWGNIVIWIIYAILELIFATRRKRGFVEHDELQAATAIYMPACRWMFFAWAVHYLPFYGMGRILYYHHYFPAHLFACMLTGLVVDCLMQICHIWIGNHRIASYVRMGIFAGVLFLLIFSFYLFYPLAYGMSGSFADFPNSTMHGMRWLKTWEF